MDDPARRAAALEALRAGQPAPSPRETFWKLHGGKVVLAAAVILGVWLLASAVGRLVRHSVSETARSEEAIRRGVR